MKKLLIIFLIFISITTLNVYAKNANKTITTTEKQTVLEKMKKKDKLKIIYVGGAIILVASTIALIPIIKEKRK